MLLLLKTHFYDVRNDNFLSQENVTKKSKIKNAEYGIISLAPPTTFKSVNKASETIGALFLVVIVATKHTTSSRMPMYQINLHINDSNTFFYYFEFGGISFRGAEGNGYMELCYENIIMIWFSIIEKHKHCIWWRSAWSQLIQITLKVYMPYPLHLNSLGNLRDSNRYILITGQH